MPGGSATDERGRFDIVDRLTSGSAATRFGKSDDQFPST